MILACINSWGPWIVQIVNCVISLSQLRTTFFSTWVLFHEDSRITGLQKKGEGIPLTPHYHFYPLYRHFDISWVITAESSPLYIAAGLEPGAQVDNHLATHPDQTIML